MSVKNFRVEHCTIQDIREFIETDNSDFAFYNTIYVNALMDRI